MEIIRTWSSFSDKEKSSLIAAIQTHQSTKRRNRGKQISVIDGGPSTKPKKKPMKVIPFAGYAERNRILHQIGFASYQDYLSSDLWKSIRKRVLKRSNKCHVCMMRATEAHHRSYHKEALLGTDIEGIFPICRDCHETIEFREGDGHKLSPKQATRKMKALRKKRKKQAKVQHVIDPLIVESEGLFRSIREAAHLGG